MPLFDDIGISTSAWADLPLEAALARIAALTSLAEIRSFGMHTLLSRSNRKAVAVSGLACTVHGPFGSAHLGDGSAAQRRALLDEHRRHLEAAAEVGAALYVAHPDWKATPGPRDARVAAALERGFAALRELQDETGVEVVVENMPGTGNSHFTHPGDLDLQGLGLILDVGHASISGCLREWLCAPQARLRHVHLQDNAGPRDAGDPHLALGAGVVDATAVVAAARAAGATMVLEHYEEAAVLASLAHLRRLGLID